MARELRAYEAFMLSALFALDPEGANGIIFGTRILASGTLRRA